MWVEQKEVNTVEFLAVHIGVGCQFQHLFKADEIFSAGRAFTDKTGPHGIMKLWEWVTHLNAFSVDCS